MEQYNLRDSLRAQDLAAITDMLIDCPEDLSRLERFEKQGGLSALLQCLHSHPTEGLTVQPADSSRSKSGLVAARKKKTFLNLLFESPLQLLFHSASVWLCLACWCVTGFDPVYLICLLHSLWTFCSEMQAFLRECNHPDILPPKCKARVLRGKKEVLVDWDDVVVGDQVKIDIHHTFYADGILLRGSECIIEEHNPGGDRIGSLKLPYSIWKESIHDSVFKRRKQKDLQLASSVVTYLSVVSRGSGWVLITALPPETRMHRDRHRLGYFLEENFSTSKLSKKISDTLIVWKIGMAITLGMACLVLGKHRLASYNSGHRKWNFSDTAQVLQLITIWFFVPRLLKNTRFRLLCRQHLNDNIEEIKKEVCINNPNVFETLAETQIMSMNINQLICSKDLTVTNFWSGEFYHVSDVEYIENAELSGYHPDDLEFESQNFCSFSELFAEPHAAICSLCFSLNLSNSAKELAIRRYLKASGVPVMDFKDSDWKLLSSQYSATLDVTVVCLQNGDRILTIIHGIHREILKLCSTMINIASPETPSEAFDRQKGSEELDQLESQGWILHSFAFAEGRHTLDSKNLTFLGTISMRPAVYPECPLKIEDFYKGRIRVLLTDIQDREISESQADKDEDIVKIMAHSLMLLPIPEEPGFSFRGCELKTNCGGLVEFPLGFRIKQRAEFLKAIKDLVLITRADAQLVQMMLTGYRNEGTKICRVELSEEFANTIFQPEMNIVIQSEATYSSDDNLVQSSIVIRRRDLRLVHEIVMASRHHREQLLKVLQYRITLWASVTGIMLLATAISKETLFSLPFLVFVYWVFDVLPSYFILKEHRSKRIWLNAPFKSEGAVLITNVVYAIFGQIFFQTSATIVLFYQGPKFLPDNVSADATHVHEVSGNLLVRSGVQSLGWPDLNERLPSRHFSYLLVIFLFMQLGSLLVSRKIRGETNVLSRLGQSKISWPLVVMILSTFILATYGGPVFRLAPGGFCIRGWISSSIFSFAVITWSLFVKALLGIHPD